MELFETFMIVGLVMVMVAGSNNFLFSKFAQILKNEGGAPVTISLMNNAAADQGLWIGIGVLFVVVGTFLYYLHRRVVGTT